MTGELFLTIEGMGEGEQEVCWLEVQTWDGHCVATFSMEEQNKAEAFIKAHSRKENLDAP